MASSWKYYHRAIISKQAPHENVDIELVKNNEIWNIGKNALFVRYTSDFDCTDYRQWWYCIKDTPINLDNIKSSKRYKIKKGLRYVEVKKIDPLEYANLLFDCFQKATKRYRCYNNNITFDSFSEDLKVDNIEYYAAFLKETDELVAYSKNVIMEDCVDFSVIKFIPEYMKYQISAALIYTMIFDYINIQKKKYVCDGERCIRHKTNIQEYLEDMFGFRKAYCKLNLIYRKRIKFIVKIIFPFRHLFYCFDGVKLISDINAILKMEEIIRKQNKNKKSPGF